MLFLYRLRGAQLELADGIPMRKTSIGEAKSIGYVMVFRCRHDDIGDPHIGLRMVLRCRRDIVTAIHRPARAIYRYWNDDCHLLSLFEAEIACRNFISRYMISAGTEVIAYCCFIDIGKMSPSYVRKKNLPCKSFSVKRSNELKRHMLS